MGADGILVSEGGEVISVPARPVQVVDATGAGDSFWAGFLMALLEGSSLQRCAYVGREIVELKLATVGPLPQDIDRAEIYRKVDESDSSSSVTSPGTQ
jgi:fructokinase